MCDSPEFSIVKIFHKNGDVAGAGFLIGKMKVLTCRHVIETILNYEKPTIEPSKAILDFTFYLDKSKKILKSHVFFWPQNKENDFVILELEDEAPSCAIIGKIMNTTGSWRESLRVCGFSVKGEATWVPLIGMGRIDSTSVQIDVSRDTGYKIEEGFSGTPVLDIKLKRIIGMVAAKENAEGILSGVYISIDSILDVCKEYSIDLKIFEFLDDSLAPVILVPSPPPNHLPRTDIIKKIKEFMMADAIKPLVITSSAKQITALQGMGGMGKSVLAADFARTREAQKEFYDGIFWVTVGLNPDLIESMKLVGTKLGDEPANYCSNKEAEASLSKVLSKKVCLIILDDVWKVLHAEPFLNALGPHCKLLITTRNYEVVTSFGAQEYKIEVLSKPEAWELLANWCDTDVNSLPLEAKKVAKKCGYLPLALSMCGAMAQNGRSWSGILRALKNADLESIEAQLPNYPNPSVMKALKVSVDFLLREEPAAVQHYKELAVFSADEFVPEAAITTLWAHTGNLKDWNVEDLLIKLKNRSLLRLDGEPPNRLISLHDLQLDYLRATADDFPYLHNQLLVAYRKKCGNKWIAGPNDGYFFKHLVYHMKEAGKREEIHKLLSDFDWMYTKLKATDVNSLISDYDYLPEDSDLRKVQKVLISSAHILARDESQLACQLLGRMQSAPEIEIQSMLEHTRKNKYGTWLRPLTTSLTPYGSPLMRTLEGHNEAVNAVAITPDDKYAISASSDGTLKVWSLETGKELCTLEGHNDSVRAVAVIPNSKNIISASSDGTLKVWDLETEKELCTLEGHNDSVRAVAVTPNGKFAISASNDRNLKVWDLETRTELRTLEGHTGWVNSVAVTSNGQYAISASDDGKLIIWDLENGTELHTLEGHNDSVRAVAVTPNGKFAISASRDCSLIVWDLNSRKQLFVLKDHIDDWVWAVTVTPDGKRAISASIDGALIVWDINTGGRLRVIMEKSHTDWINSIAVFSDGRHLISASYDRSLKVWDIENEEQFSTQEGHNGSVGGVTITPDGKHAISASSDNTLMVWDMETGKLLHTLNGHTEWVRAVEVTPDGKYAISASSDRSLKVWDLESGTELHTLKGHNDWVNSVAVIPPDGKHAISASDDGKLIIWDLESGTELHTLEGHNDWITAVAVTSNGQYAISASRNGTLIVWDMKARKPLRTLEGNVEWVWAVVTTPDNKHAISASNGGKLIFWDLETGNRLYALIDTDHTDAVKAVALSPNKLFIVSASLDKTLRVWNMKTGKIVTRFSGDSPLKSCTISRDGLSIVAGEGLGKVHFLRLEEDVHHIQ